MKRLTSLLLLIMLLSVANSFAENYPYRSDFLWVTTPDHADWLYDCGQSPKINIQFFRYGIPVTCEAEYSFSDDMLEPYKKGTINIKDGKASITMDTRKQPGFRDLVLTANIDGKKTSHHIKLGFSADKIKPFVTEPSDFMAFWNNTIQEAQKQPLSYTRELAPEYCTDKIDCWLIKLKVDRQNHYVYAYLTMPKGAKAGSHPIVICPPGAGIKTIKEPLRHKYYAENGFLRLEMEIHGLDPRLSADTFKDISNAWGNKADNYLNINLDNRDNYYMRHVYAALVRAIDFMTSLPEWDNKNVAYQGGSQGGALSLVAAGLDTRVTQCVANHPALTDMSAYSEKGRTGGYPHYNHTSGMLTPEKIKTLSYYDVINFCRHISCPTHLTWGYNDATCPPTTSYAAYNTLSCPKDALLTPINEHWTSDNTEYSHMLWIKQHLF